MGMREWAEETTHKVSINRALIIFFKLTEKYLQEEILLIPMHCLAGSKNGYKSLRTKDVVGLGYILPKCA